MNTNDTATVEQQRRRRKRINRMKNVIILTISIWMIASLVAIIILSATVVHLNGKVNRLSESVQSSQKIVMKETDTESVNSNITDTQLEENRYENVQTGIDSADNKAEAGDTHKVYLTFDSIPGENTDKILDVLKQYQVKATFLLPVINLTRQKRCIRGLSKKDIRLECILSAISTVRSMLQRRHLKRITINFLHI